MTVRKPGVPSRSDLFSLVLGWGRGIFHRRGLLQVLLALPFAWEKAAAPACPAGRTEAFSERLFILDLGLCCKSPCPAPQ